ncbi:distal tail protein Dit [Caldifermentibacillus hisashii]|uniref:distal tail protein Dit n=1 Tax=Caldifermentibacillus hisashii TaxID=996558 RepID=UPI001C11DA46|nr:distal tail protein Dit [Caldifermentibacillus hisashii]MBU5341307.1 phage tail family protein [Caldifermentibacillus hisashii]
MTEKLTVSFDGHDLSSYLIINTLDRGIGVSKKSRTQQRNGKLGVQFLGTESSLYSFPMGFSLIDDLGTKRRKLAEILNVDEPKPLEFSDEPGVFYLAYPSISGNIEEVLKVGKGTITWEIPDGVVYSKAEYEFSNRSLSGALQNFIVVDNPGTEPMLLEMEATFNSDNGFLGLENDDRSTLALFGTVEEVDGYHYETSELLFDDHLTKDKGWILNNGVTPPVTPERLQVGTVTYVVEDVATDEGYVKPSGYGTGTSWHGPSLTKIVPADKNGAYAKNWRSDWRFDFNTDGSTAKGQEVGHNSITYIDQNDEIICSVVFEDNNPSYERSDIAVYIRNQRVWDTRETNQFYVTGRGGQGPICRVEKIGNQITVSTWTGIKKTFITDNPDAELRKITWYSAAYGSNRPITNNLLRALHVYKHNVENWRDIPNKFGKGDVLTYGKDGMNIFCKINGMQGLQYRDPGSTIIKAPPERSVIYLAYSPFAETPLVRLKGRAVYVI